MTYDAMIADRDLHAALLRKVAKEKRVDALGAIVALSNAEGVVALRHGPDGVTVDRLLAEVGVPFTLSAVKGEHDAEVRQLAVEVGRTSGPVGSRTDAHGRVQISRALAARILTDEQYCAERWLEGKELGLPGSERRGSFTSKDREYAVAGCNLLETLKIGQRARDAKHAPRSGRNVAPSAGAYAKANRGAPLPHNPVQWAKPTNPYQGAYELAMAHRAKHPEAAKPDAGAVVEAERVFSLSAAPRRENGLRGPFVIAA